MPASTLDVLRPYLPHDGMVFHTDTVCPLMDVSPDLCHIASFLQRFSQSSKLECFHDWWEHDGLHFPHGHADYHGLFQLVDTPRALIESMTGEHRVFVALSPLERNWYLRFFADWDDDDSNLVGEYSISLENRLGEKFVADVLPMLKCPTKSGDVLAYFQRIA